MFWLVGLDRHLVIVMRRRTVLVGRLMKGATKTRSVEFFAGGVSNLRVMALREQRWLESTVTLDVAIVDI